MSAEALTTTIADIRDRLRRGEFPDEAAVSLGIVIPVLQDLGWPVRNMTVVTPQYAIQGRRVDYALIGRYGTPSVLLEVKRVGKIEVGEEQLFAYAFRQGTPIIVLTDGRSWRLYLTTGEGSFEDRRFASVDLVEGDPEQTASALRRYLSRESVLDGQARKHAETDLDSRWRQRKAEEALPSVWSRLAEDRDGPLVELVRSSVRDECGITPPAESVIRFLRDARPERDSAPLLRPGRTAHPDRAATPPQRQRSRDRRSGEGRYSYTLKGDTRRFRTSGEMMAAIFAAFAKNDAAFCERFRKRRSGREREYVARSREELFPGQPRLWKSNAWELPGGYFLGTHMGNPQKEDLIRVACEVAGLKFGRELTVELPVAHRTKKRL